MAEPFIVPLSSLTDTEMGTLMGLALHDELDTTDYVVWRNPNDGRAYTTGLDDNEHCLDGQGGAA